ncbi:hypothetical protein PSI15_18045, partial [Xenorhabdus sp. PR6a]|uniref:hypothetical protein n=1 Tax=Xenorhabdus sp. PR6a TaxID=3025877 RepID=UPI0023592FCA
PHDRRQPSFGNKATHCAVNHIIFKSEMRCGMTVSPKLTCYLLMRVIEDGLLSCIITKIYILDFFVECESDLYGIAVVN